MDQSMFEFLGNININHLPKTEKLSTNLFFSFLFFFFFFCVHPQLAEMQMFLDQGLNPSHSSDNANP